MERGGDRLLEVFPVPGGVTPEAIGILTEMPNENHEIAQAAFRKMQLIPISYLHTKYEGLIRKSFVGLTIDPKRLAEYNAKHSSKGAAE